MVSTYQSCLQLSRVTGDYSQIGPQFARLIVSDFGPTLTALMLARGYPEPAIADILGRNYLRVCSEVWRNSGNPA